MMLGSWPLAMMERLSSCAVPPFFCMSVYFHRVKPPRSEGVQTLCENGIAERSEVRGSLEVAHSSGICMAESSRGSYSHFWPGALRVALVAHGTQQTAIHLLFWFLVIRKLKLLSWGALLKIGFSRAVSFRVLKLCQDDPESAFKFKKDL